MKLSVHVEGKTPAEIASALRAHADTMSPTAQATTIKAPGKAGRPAKTKVEETEEEEEFDLSDQEETEEDETEEETESEEEETEEDETEEETEEEETPAISLQTVIEAFQKYAKKHSREKAAKVLAQFKAKSVRDLKKDQYAKVLGALKK